LRTPVRPEFSKFSRREFHALRRRHHLDVRRVYLHSRPRIPPETIRRWEGGKEGSVSDEFRRSLYDALRAAIIESCAATIAAMRAAQDAESENQTSSAAVSIPDFLVGGR
jgi:hypothetical protein